MGDVEYVTAFQRIVMPIAYEFNPELVIVSAGFDAAIGDPIGHYNVSPEAYAYFTHWLSCLANGRIMLCLEGGYNVNSISHAMALCTKALLGDPLPLLLTHNKKPNASCIETLQLVQSIQADYWKSIKFNKKLPDFSGEKPIRIDEVTEAFGKLQCNDTSATDSDKGSASGSSGGSGNGSSSSTNATTTPDDHQVPGPSSNKSNDEKKPTLADFLRDNDEGYAVYPLKDCPHLKLLNPDDIPKCELNMFENHLITQA